MALLGVSVLPANQWLRNAYLRRVKVESGANGNSIPPRDTDVQIRLVTLLTSVYWKPVVDGPIEPGCRLTSDRESGVKGG